MVIKLFHGTDYSNAVEIGKNGFEVKKHNDHWLGNGVYFFTDEDLAKWWTTQPSKKFGIKINHPSIIRAFVNVDDERVLDLRKLKDFKRFIEWEKEFNDVLITYAKGNIDWKQYRCALFDSIFDYKDIDMIIGCFSSDKKSYISEELYHLLRKLHLIQPEVQVCINPSKKDIIQIIEVNKVVNEG